MADEIDIHAYSRTLTATKRFINRLGVSSMSKASKPISRRNADLILEYEKTRCLEGIKAPTRTADMNRLLEAARVLKKDFDKSNKQDIKNMIAEIDSKHSPWTKTKIRMTFKRFFKWMKYGDDYLCTDEEPDEVKWIKRGMRKGDQHRIQRSECWDEKDIKKLISVATHPRDKALISVLTETGARVGEIGSLHIGDVYQDEFSYLIHLKGKTGERDDRVIYSGPCLTEWINVHPQRDNPVAPLFVQIGHPEPMKYSGICAVIKRLVRRAGLLYKKHNPHIFRHSRATLLAEQGWPEPIIKEYLGWQKDSDMMSTYSHLTSRQANRYMLKAHGIGPKEATKPRLQAQLCATCHEHNGPEAKFCKRCGRPLTHEAVLKYNQSRQKAGEILDKLVEDPEFVKMLKHFMAKKNLSA